MEQTEKQRKELPFLRASLKPYYHKPVPVYGSDLWVTPAYVGSSTQFTIFVFNENHVVRQRSFNVIFEHPVEESEGNDYRFENDNRTFVYRSPQGFKAYDVLGDTEKNWK